MPLPASPTPNSTPAWLKSASACFPAGEAAKKCCWRAVDGATAARGGKGSGDALAGSIEMLEAMKRAFETIATAKVATSAPEARTFGFLNDSDRNHHEPRKSSLRRQGPRSRAFPRRI